MTYTSETWTLSKKIENKLRTAQRAIERAMLNITRKDRIRNKNIREMMKDRIRNKNIREMMKVDNIISRAKYNK